MRFRLPMRGYGLGPGGTFGRRVCGKRSSLERKIVREAKVVKLSKAHKGSASIFGEINL